MDDLVPGAGQRLGEEVPERLIIFSEQNAGHQALPLFYRRAATENPSFSGPTG
jgi:hypothetical protein